MNKIMDILVGVFNPYDGETNKSSQKLRRNNASLQNSSDMEYNIQGTTNELYQKYASVSLSDFFHPYSTPASGVDMPSIPPESGIETEEINAYNLLPFAFNPDASGITDLYTAASGADTMTGIITGESYPGQISRYRDPRWVRSLGLHFPLVGVGWGYNPDGDPVPAGSGDGLFAGEVEHGSEVDPKDYIAAPLDVRYNDETKTWQATGGMRRHSHLENTAGGRAGGGPAFSVPFPDSLAEASGLGYLRIVPQLGKIG